VLTTTGQHAGIGELGEVVVRSPHAAAGYLDDPHATAARFVENPLGGRSDDRAYRTGDLGRYASSGEVLLAGRREDHQVKIRGHRVELGEVEHWLAHCEVWTPRSPR
jgi:non-ribosomal peptide synthetase component F